jgi:hypothetical protein
LAAYHIPSLQKEEATEQIFSAHSEEQYSLENIIIVIIIIIIMLLKIGMVTFNFKHQIYLYWSHTNSNFPLVITTA